MREWLPIHWWRVWRLTRSPVWKAARDAVNKIRSNHELNVAANREPHVSFCWACGQRPSGDRRMMEARAIAMADLDNLGIVPRRSDLDLALQIWAFITREN